MNEINYCRATSADIPDLLELRIKFLTDYWGPQTDEVVKELREGLEKYLYHAIDVNKYISWLAKVEGKIVGNGGMVIKEYPPFFKNPTGVIGYIINMYTLPEYRNRGIGSSIVSKLEEIGKDMGIKLFELHASKAGEPVYQKQGFVVHHEPTYRKYV